MKVSKINKMSALSSALDNMVISQTGENGSTEYGWGKNVQELITQFQFQLVRNTSNLDELKVQYKKILNIIFNNRNGLIDLEMVKVIYKLIAYTRDIVSGKGEYNLAYMLVSELIMFGNTYKNGKYSENFKNMACNILENFVKLNDKEHPYGSWKDLKYFCNYYYETKYGKVYVDPKILKTDPIINKVTDLICSQLHEDITNKNPTLLARWIPREKSKKFGWLTPLIAEKYYSQWFDNRIDYQSEAQYKAALRKALTHFRQLVAGLNKELNTPQINQCSGSWSDIDFDKNVTSITMRKQSKAFNLTDKRGRSRTNISITAREDREQCKKNYQKYLQDCKSGIKKVKGGRVSVSDYVKDAVNLLNYNYNDKSEIDLLNMQWNDNSKVNNEALTNVIAMIDTSASMECDNCLPLYSAIGLGIRAAEKSKLGKRVLTFNATPEWIDLDNLEFVEMVQKIKNAGWGMNTNFDAAFDMILNTAITNDISPYEMQNFILLICSDMQIDQCRTDNSDKMYERMKKKYAEAGLNSKYRTEYTLPHLIFWNMRSTTGFPSLSSTKNTSMLSGNSPVLLNSFNEKGATMLEELTPWKLLTTQLNNKRYKHLEYKIDEIWNNEYMLD